MDRSILNSMIEIMGVPDSDSLRGPDGQLKRLINRMYTRSTTSNLRRSYPKLVEFTILATLLEISKSNESRSRCSESADVSGECDDKANEIRE